jgi:hypothetical protein
MVSGMAMSLSSVTVVVSSLLLQWYRRPYIHSNGSMEKSSPMTDLMLDTPFVSTERLFQESNRAPKSFKSKIYEALTLKAGPEYQPVYETV